jgi:hypothetical protein
MTVSKNKVCLKGTKDFRILKTQKSDDDLESYSTAGVPEVFTAVAASSS